MKTLIIILLLAGTLFAQERVLLRIGPNGQQETIPLKKGERAKDVIERLEQQRAQMIQKPTGLIDTLKYFNTEAELTTNFGFTHQDVAMQWYTPQAFGTVKEFWWLNYLNRGVINKGTIRAWLIDPRVASFPASPLTKYIGTYKAPNDGDGGVQPFKPASGNQWFYSNGEADSSTYSFDMFTKEAAWLQGGLQVELDSNTWQGIKLDDWGDSMIVPLGQHFGFTLSNDTRKEDFGSGIDTRMEILSKTATGVPYHSYKYYETGRTAPANAGWHLRGDYEWGMYVVIEYTSGPRTKIVVGAYGTTLNPEPRTITATIVSDNPGGGLSGIASAYVFSKVGRLAKFDSVLMTNVGSIFTGTTVRASLGDTIYWFVAATTTSGNRSVTPTRSYLVFKKIKPYLFIYNNAGFLRANAHLIYTGASNSPLFDYWSSPSDGIGELPELLNLYHDILIADGSSPARNVYNALKERFNAATDSNPVAVFFTSQDYGCYIEQNCADTTFSPGTMEYDYFGISKLGPQDLPPTNREFRIVPQVDTVTSYLITFGADSGSTLWCDPTFELGFSGYPDAMTPRPEAKALFKDGGTNVVGVKHITSSTRVMYLGFDAGALQFRSDTALAAGNDPKYKWVPTDVGSLSLAFFNAHSIPLSVNPFGGTEPDKFSLGQNYPNPFNPSTTIEYSLAVKSDVKISIYNLLGQKVATVVNETKEPGSYKAEWNASRMASGLYFYEMLANNFTSVKKMMLLK